MHEYVVKTDDIEDTVDHPKLSLWILRCHHRRHNAEEASVGDTYDTLKTELEICQHIAEGDNGRMDTVKLFDVEKVHTTRNY